MSNQNQTLTKTPQLSRSWRVLEPPETLQDRYPHTCAEHLRADAEWSMAAASHRGKAHAHQGRFRDDAFALGFVDGWHLMVVTDGGGSRPLARVGANLAAETAIEAMKRVVEKGGTRIPKAKIARIALKASIIQAWQTIAEEAKRRQVEMRDFGTTFLSVIHYSNQEESLVGAVQIGDGILAAKIGGKVLVLQEPDMGEQAGSTLFLTSLPWEEWVDRISVGTLPHPPDMLVAMCDGVSNDFMPFEQYLPKLFDHLLTLCNQPEPEAALLEMLTYNKQGSYDDRTIAMLYRQKLLKDKEFA